jgi:aromatic ring-opening dioxygenase catalytic subunit (LigB family)
MSISSAEHEEAAIMTRLTPAIFFGHGNPMNAIGQNAYTDGWSHLGQTMPRPTAILSISAHWYVPETGVTLTTAPRTIHDFGGFPPALYRVEYPAPGDPALARRVQQLLAPLGSFVGARSRHLVGIEARLSRGGHSRRAAQH